jgi:hypothetical protein
LDHWFHLGKQGLFHLKLINISINNKLKKWK